jgi:hypothetical protein
MIFGLPRTIEHTYRSMISNLIVPNEPCDVTVALDDNTSLADNVVSALEPWLLITYSERPRCPRQRKGCTYHNYGCPHPEWLLRWQAAATLRASPGKYHYAVTVRTDTYVHFPFCVRCIYEKRPAGLARFERALHDYEGRAVGQDELKRMWMLCAGLRRMIPLYYEQPSHSLWCPRCHSALCNKTMATRHVGQTPPSALRAVHSFGSQTLTFAKASDMRLLTDELYFGWGKTFRQVFGRGLSIYCAVTEINFRLSVYVKNLTLIDYMATDDWDIQASLADIVSRRRHPVFLVRSGLHVNRSSSIRAPQLAHRSPPAPPWMTECTVAESQRGNVDSCAPCSRPERWSEFCTATCVWDRLNASGCTHGGVCVT